MANEFITDEHTAVLQKLVREVVNDPTTYQGSKWMPAIAIPTRKIRVEVMEANGGLTNEHLVGTQPQTIQRGGSRVQEYEPPAYKEVMRFTEKDLLYLRELGQNDPSKRGIRQYIENATDRLNRRLEARIELLRWQTIFNGGFSYLGKTFAFGIPAGNRVAPSVKWSLDGIAANPLANPIADLRYWVNGGYAAFRKYKITALVMNKNTARWILENTNTKAYATSYMANPAMVEYDLNRILSFLVPGMPPIEVYESWYQDETLVGDKLTVGDAIYFIPDGKIFFECKLPGGDKIGEFVEGAHLATGTIDSVGFGKFLVIEDNTAVGTKGGPQNPYIDLTAGVYGGPKLDRPFDVLTADVL